MNDDNGEILLKNLEELGDRNEAARFLDEYGFAPGEPRVDALIAWAMGGDGCHSASLRARYGS